ncbi:MAG: 5-formyltetrahydrofolate cyclo-ligase [Allobaculum sp.]|nr:5-formyltetrahydrofolate cyclo-ligase [Allobaculum sp.]
MGDPLTRQQLIQTREQIPDRPAKNQQIAARLLPFFQEAKSIGFYIPTGAEADAHVEGLVHSCGLCHLPTLVVPKVIDEGKMAFYEPKNLRPGFKGILEPPGPLAGQEEVVPEVLIIPMLCFWNGYRIGYGKGYYDRYLAKHPKCIRIGIAYDEQEDIFRPAPWDERLDFIITPTRTLVYERDVR